MTTATTTSTARLMKPEGAEHFTDELGRWESFMYTRGDRFCVVSYLGKAFRPTEHYGYPNEEKARAAVVKFAEYAEGVAARRAAAKAQRKAELAKPHGLTVGDVVANSWGYDQTNVQFFEIVKVCGVRTVEIRELAQLRENSGHMQGTCVPQPGVYIGEVMRRTVDTRGSVNVFRASFGRASKVTPAIVGGVKCYAPKSWSNYA